MLKRFCSYAGCTTLIPVGERYCSKHARTKKEDKAERNKTYDKHRRDKKAKEFYNSTQWKKARRLAFLKAKGIDVYLYIKEGKIVPATMVHHIVELKEDPTQKIKQDNLIPLSECSHLLVTAAYKTDRRQEIQKELRECKQIFEERCKDGGRGVL